MNNYSQYFTPKDFSSFLVKQIEESPKTILELGIGEGALMNAALTKWSGIKYYGVDIDQSKVDFISKQYPSQLITNLDGLKDNIKSKLGIKLESIDLAICNPPFKKIKIKDNYRDLFESVGLGKLCTLDSINSEIVFFSQNLKYLKKDGAMGIILPDGIITGSRFRVFREAVLERLLIKDIYELPNYSFKNTEAKTHIIILKNKRPENNHYVRLHKVDKYGKTNPGILVSKSNLIDRMDYTYNAYLKGIQNNNKFTTLKSLNPIVKRGKRSRKYLLESEIRHFHTTDFTDDNNSLNFGGIRKAVDTTNYAEKGDILLARVGSRCIGRSAFITKGKIEVSDCVFIIRVSSKYQQIVYKSIKSKSGQDYINSVAHGVCSKFLSKEDVLNIPICL